MMQKWAKLFRASIVDLTPQQLALLLAVGLVLGIFPIPGCPTLLCLAAAAGLRLNVAVLQLLNNVTGPLQLALLLPLERAGAWFCGDSRVLAGEFGAMAMYAVIGWACICIPAGILVYLVLVRAPWRIGRPFAPVTGVVTRLRYHVSHARNPRPGDAGLSVPHRSAFEL